MKTSTKIYYTDKQVNDDRSMSKSFSKSPLKPKLYMQKLNTTDIEFEVIDSFKPLTQKDFQLAHTRSYVESMFRGTGNCNSNGIPWSQTLADSLKYTSSSLYHAIKHSIQFPQDLCVSPTSGFHHAKPTQGSGFCSFSGQVIASMKLFNEIGVIGAYFDLDGHYGNSIADSVSYVMKKHKIDLRQVIRYNVNPHGTHNTYIQDFNKYLKMVRRELIAGNIHYVVWCHGADSHEWDQLGCQCTTTEWFTCSSMFYQMIAEVEEITGRHIPVTLSLFGGYRDDDYDSVINLHVGDLAIAQTTLLDKKCTFRPVVKCVNKKSKTIYNLSEK